MAAKFLSRSIYHNEQSLDVKTVAYFISYLEVWKQQWEQPAEILASPLSFDSSEGTMTRGNVTTKSKTLATSNQPGFTPLRLSQPRWSSFRGRSKKGNTKIKAALTKGKDYFCMYTPVFTNWLWNTGTFTTCSAQAIAMCRTQDTTEFLSNDHRRSRRHQPLTGLNNFL